MRSRGEAGFLRMAEGRSRDAGKRVRASLPAPGLNRTSGQNALFFYAETERAASTHARSAYGIKAWKIFAPCAKKYDLSLDSLDRRNGRGMQIVFPHWI